MFLLLSDLFRCSNREHPGIRIHAGNLDAP